MPVTDQIISAIPARPGGGTRKKRQLPLLASLLFGAIAASLLILKFAPAPFFWVWLAWAAVLFAATFRVHGDWLRPILFNLGIVACFMAGAEAYFFTADKYIPPTRSNGFFVDNDILGWAPTKGMQAHAVETGPAGLFHHPAGVVFDATYTIDANGLRVAPPYREEDLAGTALFFGCSYTFGSGLNDDETLPYQVGVQSGGRYRAYNFAFEAYSPAQMLAALEHGMVRRVVDTAPGYAYYVAIPHHVWRVAGRVPWLRHEPRYVLDADGTLHRAGYFEDHQPLALRLGLGRRVAALLDKSAMWQRFTAADSHVTDEDIRLYLAMVRRSQELLTAQYPGIQFRVILWPGHSVEQRSIYEKMRAGFLGMGIPVDLVEDILPGYRTNEARFTLSPGDTHPNALADRLLAQHILHQIEP